MKRETKSEISARITGLNLGSILGAGASGGRHPMDDFDFRVTDEMYLMNPHRVVLEGPYVRTAVEDVEFQEFCRAVQEQGGVEQPIGIRTAGPPTDRRYILIYGMRRWKAALSIGLEKIPVRDHGEISEEESLALQMVENETRKDPRPVETAFGYHQLVSLGRRQADLARLVGRDRSYVSMMRAVGEGIALLSDAERRQLNASPSVTVRVFQEIAKLADGPARVEALRELLHRERGEVEAAVSRRDQQRDSLVHARDLRDGRSFRLQWRNADLRDSPEKVVESVHAAVMEEYRVLADRLREMESAQGGAGKRGRRTSEPPKGLRAAVSLLEEALRRMEAAVPQE